jgi:hypothetical protein
MEMPLEISAKDIKEVEEEKSTQEEFLGLAGTMSR